MKDTINKDQFISWFRSSDTYRDNFSYEGLSALFDYLEEMEESTDAELEFDPVALCCEYAEYESLNDLIADYIDSGGISWGDDVGIEYFENRTTVIQIEETNGIIIQQF
tara:strand:+ start:134 stop:460 length:327 start_codon:yes stop_codon:yes gene_type:complete